MSKIEKNFLVFLITVTAITGLKQPSFLFCLKLNLVLAKILRNSA